MTGVHPLELFFVNPDAVRDEGLLRAYRDLLSDEERRRHDRFHFEHDRHHFLVAHALLRTAVGRYVEADPGGLEFVTDHRGRPELAPGQGKRPARFNLSHTRGLVVVGVTPEHDVGVDVEREREVNLAVADRHFAPSEVAALGALPGLSEQRQRFFTYWTLKESYIKARGEGLRLPLDRFAFLLDEAPPRLEVDPELDDQGDRWSWAVMRVGDGHQAAWAVRGGAGAVCSWRAFTEKPLVGTEPLTPRVMRCQGVDGAVGGSG